MRDDIGTFIDGIRQNPEVVRWIQGPRDIDSLVAAARALCLVDRKTDKIVYTKIARDFFQEHFKQGWISVLVVTPDIAFRELIERLRDDKVKLDPETLLKLWSKRGVARLKVDVLLMKTGDDPRSPSIFDTEIPVRLGTLKKHLSSTTWETIDADVDKAILETCSGSLKLIEKSLSPREDIPVCTADDEGTFCDLSAYATFGYDMEGLFIQDDSRVWMNDLAESVLETMNVRSNGTWLGGLENIAQAVHLASEKDFVEHYGKKSQG